MTPFPSIPRTSLPSLLIGLAMAAAAAAPKSDPPNILMLAIDDLRPMLGCYGDPRVRTPHIDRLAARSLLFERAYCQYAKCGTSRLSLLTGLRPDSVGVFSNRDRDVEAFRERRPDAIALGQHFQQAGYHTQSFGKIYHDGWDHPADWSVPSSPGRDREMWEIVNESSPAKETIIAERLACPVLQSPDVADDHLFAGRMTNEVIDTLSKLDRGTPFFLAVGYRRPHLPFVAPQPWFDLYEPDESWLAPHARPLAGAPVMAWFNSDGYVGAARRVGLTMPMPPDRAEARAWNGYELRSYLDVPYHGPISRAKQLDLLQAYAACISYVDAQIGRLLDALEQESLHANTIVVLWSEPVPSRSSSISIPLFAISRDWNGPPISKGRVSPHSWTIPQRAEPTTRCLSMPATGDSSWAGPSAPTATATSPGSSRKPGTLRRESSMTSASPPSEHATSRTSPIINPP